MDNQKKEKISFNHEAIGQQAVEKLLKEKRISEENAEYISGVIQYYAIKEQQAYVDKCMEKYGMMPRKKK